MLHPTLTIPPGPAYWPTAARALFEALPRLLPSVSGNSAAGADLSGLRVVVPAHLHAPPLRDALAALAGGSFVPPRICTLQGWLSMQPPDSMRAASSAKLGSGNERLMTLYAELRQHAWLKKLFAARRNTDLLPLAQTLLSLADELTTALWPVMQHHPDDAEARWEAALGQLPAAARAVLSEEAQLVWSVWKSQLDADDPTVARFARMMTLADNAATPLVWIAAMAPDACEQAFLAAWSLRRPVLPLSLDWRAEAIAPAMAAAWPELIDAPADAVTGQRASARQPDFFEEAGFGVAAPPMPVASPHAPQSVGLALCAATSLEEEAQSGAQTVLDWLAGGRTAVAIVAQDRVVARRIRALLQRAGIHVADETGWKLSTTRAAAALAAWFDVITLRAETTAVLDFLKSPFLPVDADSADADVKAEQVMAIELALRRGNVGGGWRALIAAAPAGPAREWLQQLSAQAAGFRDRHTIEGWLALTMDTLDALGIGPAFAADAAGMQVTTMLDMIGEACGGLTQVFSFAEWRAFVGLHLEATAFLPPVIDRRVVMLPLNGMHLRSFEAVLVVGADAAHLPSTAGETLFFANAVRRELGLPTRESRQLQQLRDFAGLLSFNPTVVLSWQAHRDGEPNPLSNWVARLDLVLERSVQARLSRHHAPCPTVALTAVLPRQPAPSAPELRPDRLSASGYASLAACPYQFFATRMLGLSGLDELSDQLEKRDYGDWLHQILHRYHVGVRDAAIPLAGRAAFLADVTQHVFGIELARSGAALGFLDRWQKAMPAYLEWANAREAAGWHFMTGEERFEQPLRWEGGEIVLHGRIDRIDRGEGGQTAVLDYKTSNLGALKKRIEANEDHQLAFYGLLADTPPASASYVALEPLRDRIGEVPAPDYDAWQQRLRRQIGDAMQAIEGGAGLPAAGIDLVCQYCDVRGLCRKGAW